MRLPYFAMKLHECTLELKTRYGATLAITGEEFSACDVAIKAGSQSAQSEVLRAVRGKKAKLIFARIRTWRRHSQKAFDQDVEDVNDWAMDDCIANVLEGHWGLRIARSVAIPILPLCY
jgi:hypothetical protein